jgi:hypothetical protein
MIHRFRTAALTLLIGAACARTTGAPPNAPASAGLSPLVPTAQAAMLPSPWISLFDGRTLTGWRGLGSSGVPTAHWVVDSGMIRKIPSGKVPVQADGQPLVGGDLMTEGTWRDFELEWEWKIAPGGNSGIKYNVSEERSVMLEPTHAAKAFEYQMLDDDRHPDGKLPTHRAGALYDLVAPNAAKVLRAVGEWNSSRIILAGNHGEHWLNGAKIVSYELGTAAMDSALTASKYHGWPWFADRRSGHIVIQDHGDEVWIRNIRIRSLRTATRDEE